MTLYASGRKALALCDICGFQYKLKQLRKVVRNRVQTGLKACPKCWDPQHPQEELGRYRVADAQALRDPRPDHAELATARGLGFQIPGASAIGYLDSVEVSVT